jgi:tRNA pseudouridine32 synthase/23S rRNA pseudouridine746 synthase
MSKPSSPHGKPLLASTFVLPQGPWPTLLAGLCAAFGAIPPEAWQDRFARGRVLGEDHQPLDADMPYRAGLRLYYFRELAHEPPIPFTERILYQDEHLLVADKPPFLPVIPTGRYVQQSLLYRLASRLENPELQPLHRIDRHTSGLVLFSLNQQTRGRYQQLFSNGEIHKSYEALAPALPEQSFPHIRRSRIERDSRFFRSCEVEGPINAQSRIEVVEQGDGLWRYRLTPITGKKHQLRLHMAALGAPICHDALYPQVDDGLAEDHTRPLQLLAKELTFTDPLTGKAHHFVSEQQLAALNAQKA